MKYLLLIYNDEQRWNEKTQADREDVYYEYRKLMS